MENCSSDSFLECSVISAGELGVNVIPDPRKPMELGFVRATVRNIEVVIHNFERVASFILKDVIPFFHT